MHTLHRALCVAVLACTTWLATLSLAHAATPVPVFPGESRVAVADVTGDQHDDNGQHRPLDHPTQHVTVCQVTDLVTEH